MSNLLKYPTFSPTGDLNAIIEIPAGTNMKFEVDKETGIIRPDTRDGKPRVIDFLPYPVNYGFFPSTKMDKPRGGDGDPLDVMVLAESKPSGTLIEVKPIALMMLQDEGEWDNKVLAIPADPEHRIIKADNWRDFQMQYSPIRHILEWYFMYYDGLGVMKVMGWADENAALNEVKKWQITP